MPMGERIAVAGLWHLGTVTAAVMAEAGHDVVAFDVPEVVGPIDRGEFPVAEPELAEVWSAQRAVGRLRTTSNVEDLADRAFVWVCYDTPLDTDDRPDTEFVVGRVRQIVDRLGVATVAVSSQLPVGSVAALVAYARGAGKHGVGFVSIPENLRLGSALAYLRKPDRFVVGSSSDVDRARVAAVLEPFGAPIAEMRVESAEMTKHALNAFLATSVVFANEIAAIAERVGADAREIEEGLKSDVRIGRRAYVRAGEAFAGGTLARDITFLRAIGAERDAVPLQIAATYESNEHHKTWIDREAARLLAGTPSPRIAILGLTYKPGTDTLRSSTAVGLGRRLTRSGARVTGFDPAIRADRPELGSAVMRAASVEEALLDADIAIVMTPWPEFREIAPATWQCMRHRRVIDPQRFLEATAGPYVDDYAAFGRPDRAGR